MTDGTEAAVAAAEAAEASASAAEAAGEAAEAVAQTEQSATSPVAETAEVVVAAAGAAVALANTEAAKAELDAALTNQAIMASVEEWKAQQSAEISSLKDRFSVVETVLPSLAEGIASIQTQLTQPVVAEAETDPETGAVQVTVQSGGEESPAVSTEPRPRHKFL